MGEGRPSSGAALLVVPETRAREEGMRRNSYREVGPFLKTVRMLFLLPHSRVPVTVVPAWRAAALPGHVTI